MDDDNSKTLDQYEFLKAVADYRVGVSRDEAFQIFKLFDRDGNGHVDYDEFLRAVVGEMNQFRVNYVNQAFKKIDKDGNGVLNIDDVKGVYNAKFHPDVKIGKKTEDEVLYEFLDTFEMHYSLNHPGSRDRTITLDEFIEYYNNISISIDDDSYFQLMMTNAWNLDNKTYAKGWAGEY